MNLARRVFALFAVAANLFWPVAAFADAKDAVLNKEGYWGIDVDRGACAASMTLQGGAIFLLRAQKGQVTFGLFGKRPMARGKAGRIETEAYRFDFAPSYGEDATTLYTKVGLDARALAALRLARQVRILTDGQPVAAMTFEGTGFEGALDGVIACSMGQTGWWGPGVGAKTAEAPPAGKSGYAPVMNKEGDWELGASSVAGVCVGQAKVDEHVILQILGASGQLSVAVGSDKALPRGRKGHVQTDSYAFDFTPDYNGDDYMSSRDTLDSQATFALRRAKWIRVSVDGRQLFDADVTDTGFPELMDSAAACSRGEAGWWGKGAKPRP